MDIYGVVIVNLICFRSLKVDSDWKRKLKNKISGSLKETVEEK